MLPCAAIPNSKDDLRSHLLPSIEQQSDAAADFKVANEEKGDDPISISLGSLERMQLQQLVVKDSSDDKTRAGLFSSTDLKESVWLSPQLHQFLQALGITEGELVANGVDIELLDKTINKNLNGKILRWLVLENWLIKFFQFPLLDERGINHAEIIPVSKSCCGVSR